MVPSVVSLDHEGDEIVTRRYEQSLVPAVRLYPEKGCTSESHISRPADRQVPGYARAWPSGTDAASSYGERT